MTMQNDHSTTLEREALKTKPPSKYAVSLVNDDFTPMEFVMLILQEYFNKGLAEAEQITMHVHNAGKGICGLFTKDIAEAKVQQVRTHAIAKGHPLKCIMEEV